MKKKPLGIATRLLGSLCIALASGFASALNLSDHWHNADEPGWGLTITQQGDVLFAVLLVYSGTSVDASGRGAPEWYVIPAMRQPNFFLSKLSPVPPLFYTGALYATRGSPFTGPFDPASMQTTPAGEAALTPDNSGAEAQLTYRIGTTTVTKRIRRMSMASLPLTGQYFVTVSGVVNSATSASSCAFVGSFARAETWVVDASGTGGSYRITRVNSDLMGNGPDPMDVTQAGSTATLGFRSTFGPLAGTWTVQVEHAGTGGFSGTLQGRSDSTVTFTTDSGPVTVPECSLGARISGTRVTNVNALAGP